MAVSYIKPAGGATIHVVTASAVSMLPSAPDGSLGVITMQPIGSIYIAGHSDTLQVGDVSIEINATALYPVVAKAVKHKIVFYPLKVWQFDGVQLQAVDCRVRASGQWVAVLDYLLSGSSINDAVTGGFATIADAPNGSGNATLSNTGISMAAQKTSATANGKAYIRYRTKKTINLSSTSQITAAYQNVAASGGTHTIGIVLLSLYDADGKSIKGINKYWDMNLGSVSGQAGVLTLDTAAINGDYYVEVSIGAYATQGSGATVSCSGTFTQIKLI
ncbi:hypothetical protein CE91St44_27890 [Oscillospiraceae bacterium]|nr:hypothetical protein CE91St44_27890 [Oscillospiraceae bacterium]